MEIVILPDNEAIGSLAADAIGNLLQRRPNAVLGLASGSSPLAIYDELATRCAAGTITSCKRYGSTAGSVACEFTGGFQAGRFAEVK